MNIDYHLYNVTFDYIGCNIQAYILYVINADNTILYYTLIYNNISLHSITQSLCFSMRHYITRAFSQFVVARIHVV